MNLDSISGALPLCGQPWRCTRSVGHQHFQPILPLCPQRSFSDKSSAGTSRPICWNRTSPLFLFDLCVMSVGLKFSFSGLAARQWTAGSAEMEKGGLASLPSRSYRHVCSCEALNGRIMMPVDHPAFHEPSRQSCFHLPCSPSLFYTVRLAMSTSFWPLSHSGMCLSGCSSVVVTRHAQHFINSALSVHTFDFVHF